MRSERTHLLLAFTMMSAVVGCSAGSSGDSSGAGPGVNPVPGGGVADTTTDKRGCADVQAALKPVVASLPKPGTALPATFASLAATAYNDLTKVTSTSSALRSLVGTVAIDLQVTSGAVKAGKKDGGPAAGRLRSDLAKLTTVCPA